EDTAIANGAPSNSPAGAMRTPTIGPEKAGFLMAARRAGTVNNPLICGVMQKIQKRTCKIRTTVIDTRRPDDVTPVGPD
ncbi:hypothetical protein MXD81_27020, partial [Microbacteriaceae bacterium K1510]|nr:hypothetical protein [Microbacteriaceae bacterium K1510]